MNDDDDDVARPDVRLFHRLIRWSDGIVTEWAPIDTDGHGYTRPPSDGAWGIVYVGVLLRPGQPPVLYDDFEGDLGEFYPDPMSLN